MENYGLQAFPSREEALSNLAPWTVSTGALRLGSLFLSEASRNSSLLGSPVR